MEIHKALEDSKTLPPQSKINIMRGLDLRRTSGGLPLISVHYTANPERDPEIHPEWKSTERKTYSSQASWDREQEIVDNAGGGALVFADTLVSHWTKIVITDPGWRPGDNWDVLGGFDHGKTNPTSLLRAYVDFDGNIFICGEYYMPGKEVWQHAPELLRMPDVNRFKNCFADPTVFDKVHQQSNSQNSKEQAKAIVDLYYEQGVNFLEAFSGNRNDLTFAGRLMQHWRNLEEHAPSLFIVCNNYTDRPQPGLHQWSCPNLLWELMRTRKKKLTAQQLLHKNPAEEIIDKDNHSRDALKYIVMSLPEPAEKSATLKLNEVYRTALETGDETSAAINVMRARSEFDQPTQPAYFGRRPRYR